MHFASIPVDSTFQNNWRQDSSGNVHDIFRSSFSPMDDVDSDIGLSLLADCSQSRWKNLNLSGVSQSQDRVHKCSTGCQRVTINVSGMRFETQLRTLNRLPDTLLGNPAKRKSFWDHRYREYFFDRHRPSFQAVLYFYQSGGKLKRPFEVPFDVFLSELQFYELGPAVIEAFKRREGVLIPEKLLLPSVQWKRVLWQTFEDPSSSWKATFLMIFSVLVIVTSLVAFCLETLPVYKNTACDKEKEVVEFEISYEQKTQLINMTLIDIPLELNGSSPENETLVKSSPPKTPPNYKDPFFILDAICISWFCIELFLRFVSCPSKKSFLKTPMNIIDALAIIPFYVTLCIGLATGECVDSSTSGFLLTLRVLRVARIFKLGKHSQGLQILAKTIRASLRELILFAMFLFLAVVIFSSAIYFAEHDGNASFFPSIPHSFWYTIVTMTTVGYGDAVPIGIAGKLIGSLCVLAGVLVIALPVPVVVTNFSIYYSHATGRGIMSYR